MIQPQHVCIVGVRSFEPEEAERLERLGVRVFLMDEIHRRGLDAVFEEALGIATTGTDSFGISIDLDVVSPEEVPNVGTPVAGGLASVDLARVLRGFGSNPHLAAVELVEYSPRLDRDGRSARVAVDLLAAALCGPREDAQVLAEAFQRQDS